MCRPAGLQEQARSRPNETQAQTVPARVARPPSVRRRAVAPAAVKSGGDNHNSAGSKQQDKPAGPPIMTD